MRLAEITVDQARALVVSVLGVLILFTGLKSPLNPAAITTACSLLGFEPAMRTRPHDEPVEEPSG